VQESYEMLEEEIEVTYTEEDGTVTTIATVQVLMDAMSDSVIFTNFYFDVGIKNALNCYDVQVSFNNENAYVCKKLFAGYIELIVLYCISIPLNIVISIFAVQFVLRNRIDIEHQNKDKDNKKKIKN
jgi:hypothetical protein